MQLPDILRRRALPILLIVTVLLAGFTARGFWTSQRGPAFYARRDPPGHHRPFQHQRDRPRERRQDAACAARPGRGAGPDGPAGGPRSGSRPVRGPGPWRNEPDPRLAGLRSRPARSQTRTCAGGRPWPSARPTMPWPSATWPRCCGTLMCWSSVMPPMPWPRSAIGGRPGADWLAGQPPGIREPGCHGGSRKALASRLLPALTLALDSSSALRRQNAATVLGYIGSPQADPALQLAVVDPNPDVRSEAAWALAEIDRGNAN